MMEPTTLYQQLVSDEVFADWQKIHADAFLSHFFCPLSAQYEEKAGWEVGYFDPSTQKITTFSLKPEGSFLVKEPEDVFKREEETVDPLPFNAVMVDFARAKALCQEEMAKNFSSQKIGDGFVILQKINERTLWNFTFISVTLQFLNVKIDATDAAIVGAQSINVIDKQAGLGAQD